MQDVQIITGCNTLGAPSVLNCSTSCDWEVCTHTTGGGLKPKTDYMFEGKAKAECILKAYLCKILSCIFDIDHKTGVSYANIVKM